MSEEIFHIRSITQLHELMGSEKPKHPLISVLDASKLPEKPEFVGVKMSADFYIISLKEHDCGMHYGRNYYDFEEGALMFTAPGQVMTATEQPKDIKNEGWMLFFHPDLIRMTALGDRIDDYTFFDYESHEALHLSEEEKQIINACVKNIELEYNANTDGHSQSLFVSNLELILNYSKRFYDRQFHTRTTRNKDVVSDFERHLKDYFKSEELADLGQPSVQYFAEKVHLSANYLSDLLKKETGRNVKEHINEILVKKAKTMLLNSSRSVSEIAYDLGFNYPHYFSRMFKAHTGYTPANYRESVN